MACGVCARSTRRAASLPSEGSTHLRGCGMTAVGPEPKRHEMPRKSAATGRSDLPTDNPDRRC
jgi:hypothetical protein